jgi:hypothetical protein
MAELEKDKGRPAQKKQSRLGYSQGGVLYHFCSRAGPLTPELSALLRTGEHLVASHVAVPTASQYAKHVKYFARFVLHVNQAECLYEPTQSIVVAYVAFLARSCSYKTIKNYLQGLREFWENSLGHNPMADWLKVKWALQGVRRIKGDSTSRKRPITPQMLLSFLRLLDFSQPQAVCVFTAMLVAFFGFFRKSNVTVRSPSLFDSSKNLCRGDVRVDLSKYCLWVQLRWTKTIQFQERVVDVPIMGLKNHPLDPVAWWQRLCAAVPAPASAPAFCYLDAGGKRQVLTHAQLVQHTKTLVAKMGLDPASVSGHSFRRGGASYAAMAGVPAELIKLQGDWRSDAYKLYCVLPSGEKLRTTYAMWQHMRRFRFGGELHV